MKIEVNFFEPVLFGERERMARTLLDDISLTNEELKKYSKIHVTALFS
ncbi:hypothetical protein [Pyrococcus sp. NA2]|nr:hypothetical protein [Pyrococcus sp. NA2]